jgi:hypothetical protein
LIILFFALNFFTDAGTSGVEAMFIIVVDGPGPASAVMVNVCTNVYTVVAPVKWVLTCQVE